MRLSHLGRPRPLGPATRQSRLDKSSRKMDQWASEAGPLIHFSGNKSVLSSEDAIVVLCVSRSGSGMRFGGRGRWRRFELLQGFLRLGDKLLQRAARIVAGLRQDVLEGQPVRG